MNRELYDYIVNKEHHQYRRNIDRDLATEYSALGLSHPERMTRRFEFMCESECPVILPGERIVFIRTCKNIPTIITEGEMEELRREHYIHELGYMNNVSPDYYGAIGKGLIAMRDEADEYAKREIDALLALCDRYLKEARRQGREDIASVLERVPRYPARSFTEALQFFRILHFALWLEGNYHMTVGRFDRYVYPYLKADLESGALDEDEALDLLEEFFLTFNRDSDLYPGVQQGDNGQSLMLGGVDEKGNEVFNTLSSLCLRASRNNKLIDPKINLRVNKNTPLDRFIEATELTKIGLGFPQYSNDDVVIPGLIRLGYSPEDAANYTVAACWEFISPNQSFDVPNISRVNFPQAVERAVNEHLCDCASFEDFLDAVKVCMEEDCQKIALAIKDKTMGMSPYLSVFVDDCIERGLDVSEGGAVYNNYGAHGVGISSAADAIAAVRKAVFEDEKCGKRELVEALKANFKGYTELRNYLLSCPKMGNNDDYVDIYAELLMDIYADVFSRYKTPFGGVLRPGTGSAMEYLRCGATVGATADGRYEKASFSSSFSPSIIARLEGPLSCIQSFTKYDLTNIINGGPLTMEIHDNTLRNRQGIKKVAKLVKIFVELGGHQLQLNSINRDVLLDAQKHPEDHKNLIVRVGGWSGYFNELDLEYQNHIISRTDFNL